MDKRIVEVFTAGCPVCDETVEMVNSLSCPSCEVTVYDLNKGCETNVCREKAKEYGLKRLPAVVVDGKPVDIFSVRGITKDSLVATGIGKE